ncbi:unnamed protein product, partial [Scytosiphon promiscuus]
MAERAKSFDLGGKISPSFSKLRRGADLAPATLELKETFALRRILLKHTQRTEDECSFVRKFLAERTTIWREPFWALLSKKEQLKVAQCVKLRMVPSDGEPHDFVAADSASGCMIFSSLKGVAQQVQCFDSSGTRLEFHALETFGFLPVPETLTQDALRGVEKVKSNPRSKVYRGERECGERRQATTDAGKIRVKIAPDGQYLSISGAEVVPVLKKVAEKRGRCIKSRGSLSCSSFNTMISGGRAESACSTSRYGVGSKLVEEGADPTMVFVIVEGECRIVKSGKPRSLSRSQTQPNGAKGIGSRSARYNLGSAQSSKVGVVLTSGFHTQVDVCQLGSLGPKALIGDIPALLGGVQPASVVAKTPLRVLQCRADKFAAHLDHNSRAKTVFVEAAKARKTRMMERGAEVDQLMSLAGTPLLVDMSTSRAGATGSSGTSSAGHAFRVPNAAIDRGNASEAAGKAVGQRGPLGHDTVQQPVTTAGTSTPASAAAGKCRGSTTDSGSSRNRVEHQAGPATTSSQDRTVVKPAAEEVAQPQRGGSGQKGSKALLPRSRSTPPVVPFDEASSQNGTPANTTVVTGSAREVPNFSLPLGLEAGRIAATASTPQLPCFSMESSPQRASLERRAGEPGGATLQPSSRRTLNCDVVSPSLAVAGASPAGGVHYGGSGGAVAMGVGEPALAKRAALTAARDEASTLLASHLMPFPTITKNRSLHAVSQPIVRHSDGFADACRAESSRLGTAAWRMARDARYHGLVAQEDRLSILRQIEAGFDALQ